MNTKAFVSVHAGSFLVVGLIVGMALMYFLVLKGIIPMKVPIKP